MTSQLIYPHIEKTNLSEPARLQRIPRVRVAQIVMDYLAYGWSVEEMCRQHGCSRPPSHYRPTTAKLEVWFKFARFLN